MASTFPWQGLSSFLSSAPGPAGAMLVAGQVICRAGVWPIGMRAIERALRGKGDKPQSAPYWRGLVRPSRASLCDLWRAWQCPISPAGYCALAPDTSSRVATYESTQKPAAQVRHESFGAGRLRMGRGRTQYRARDTALQTPPSLVQDHRRMRSLLSVAADAG